MMMIINIVNLMIYSSTNKSGGGTVTQKTFLLIKSQYILAQTGPHQVVSENYMQMLMEYIYDCNASTKFICIVTTCVFLKNRLMMAYLGRNIL